MVSLENPLDLSSREAQTFLESVQGNIIKGHGRKHTAHIFVSFPKQMKSIKSWIKSLASATMTTAKEQLSQAQERKLTSKSSYLFCSILLSYKGYLALDVPDDAVPSDDFFKAGMKQHNAVGRDIFNDPDPALWEPGFGKDVHAMILFASDDEAELTTISNDHVSQLDDLGCSCFVEWGNKLTYDFGSPRGRLDIEHFGHQDGISNPNMINSDIAEETKQRGADHWDPSAPLKLAIVSEPHENGGFGSFMVFRKLEQNVKSFGIAKQELADRLDVDVETAAGLVVGRLRDGTPVIPATANTSNADINDFDFSGDRPDKPGVARLCPFHSHIRRTNPRGDIPHYGGPPFEFERSMRIVRRGITYGERVALYDPDPAVQPETGVGLLFMSFQANLRQFSIQQAGSDDEIFPYGFTEPSAISGLEGLIGRANDPDNVKPQTWPVGGADSNETRDFLMMDFVRMLGGEYFFAPSPQFFRAKL